MINSVISANSIDKAIVDAAPKAAMFDFFHVMPDNSVELMAEWDLLLTINQYNALYTRPGKRGKRKAIKDVVGHWKSCIVYYEITESLNTTVDKALIKEAMDEWRKYTCLDFRENSNMPSRIQFKDGGGCYSQLGKQDKPQPLVLARGCRKKGIIAHEIGHAIGWIHEHMRPDRDDYIHVNLAGVDEKFHSSFEKYPDGNINTYGIPYDYTSLMHYGNSVFPSSLIARDPKYQEQLGQRIGLSFKDIKLANIMYGCATMANCTPPKYNKHSDGFQMANNYKNKGRCQMWCDSGKISDPLILCTERKSKPSTPKPTAMPTAMPKKQCMDIRKDCQVGECETKMKEMIRYCSKTCNFCDKGKDLCMDYDKGCPLMAAGGACEMTGLKKKMKEICKASCKLCPKPTNPCTILKEMMGHDQQPSSAANYVLSHLITTFALTCFTIVISSF